MRFEPLRGSSEKVEAEVVIGLPPQERTDDRLVPRKPHRWRLVGQVAGVIVSLVSVVTGVIAVIPILTRDASDVSTIEATAMAFPESATEWALPTSTDFATFPDVDGEACNETQRAWLEARGTPVTTRVLLDLRNVASEGPMATVKEFVLDGPREQAGEGAILVICDSQPESVATVQTARLDAGVAEGAATYSAEAFGAGDRDLPDIPVTWNLAPGATGVLVLRFTSNVDFEGSLAATVLAGDQSRELELELDGGEPIRLVNLVGGGLTYFVVNGSLECRDETSGSLVACDPTDLLAASNSD